MDIVAKTIRNIDNKIQWRKIQNKWSSEIEDDNAKSFTNIQLKSRYQVLFHRPNYVDESISNSQNAASLDYIDPISTNQPERIQPEAIEVLATSATSNSSYSYDQIQEVILQSTDKSFTQAENNLLQEILSKINGTKHWKIIAKKWDNECKKKIVGIVDYYSSDQIPIQDKLYSRSAQQLENRNKTIKVTQKMVLNNINN